VVISESAILDDLIDLDRHSLPSPPPGPDEPAETEDATSGLKDMLLDYERKLLVRCLEQKNTSRELATLLKTSQSTVIRRLRKHGLTHMLR
jgi:transcriptional regulator of aromatic amino acid metabolism